MSTNKLTTLIMITLIVGVGVIWTLASTFVVFAAVIKTVIFMLLSLFFGCILWWSIQGMVKEWRGEIKRDRGAQ